MEIGSDRELGHGVPAIDPKEGLSSSWHYYNKKLLGGCHRYKGSGHRY